MINFKNVTKYYTLSNVKTTSLREVFSFHILTRNKNITKFYALKNVSFHVKKGDCLGIIGHNGAGKSTILKLISRVTLPSGGVITLDGKVSSLLEVGTGFHQDLTGIDNIFLSGAILGMSNDEVKHKLDEIIEFAEIGSFIHEPVKYYSMGMYLRLAFAIGISLDSDILVIDEALSVGDSNFQQKCLNKIQEILKENRTIIFVSHDINQIRKICTTALVMDKGELIFHGDVSKAENIYQKLRKGE